MVVTSLLAALLATASAQQVRDASTQARDAYTACLRQFMERSTRDRMALSAFTEALPQQCTAQEQAFRAAIRTREAGFRTPAAEIQEIADQEIEDARANIREIFEMGSTPA